MAAMNRQERELAERHLYLVRDTVLGTMSLNESIQGFGYDDLYQTGCEALCHAAQKYRAEGGASFPTFASVVIRNRLISHCRKVARTQKPLEYMDAPQPSGSGLTFADAFPDDSFHGISDADTFFLLSQAKEWYYVKKKYKLNVDFFAESTESDSAVFRNHVFQIIQSG